MKLSNIMREMLNEAPLGKKTINTIAYKWFGNAKDGLEKTTALLDRFEVYRSKKAFKKHKLATFHAHYPLFDLKYIEDPTKYTYKQLLDFVTILEEKDEVDSGKLGFYDEVFNEISDNKTKEQIEKSKELFHSDKNLVFEKDGVRVYDMKTMKESQIYGYYVDYINKDIFENTIDTWCVTARTNNNLWSTYRPDLKFYFIIDDNRDPERGEKDKFFLSAFQVLKRPIGLSRFRVTSVINDGDFLYSDADLLNIYPQLKKFIESDTPKYVTYNRAYELGSEVNKIIYHINEVRGGNYEFAKQTNEIKLQYIQARRPLTKKLSWESLTPSMKSNYLSNVTRENYSTLLGSSELLGAIVQNGQNMKYLNRILGRIGIEGGYEGLNRKLFQRNYYLDERKSLENDHISLYRSRITNKFGIYSTKTSGWLKKSGILYDDKYELIDTDYYTDDDDNFLIVNMYSKTSSFDNTSFVVVSTYDEMVDGHFISAKSWNRLKERIDKRDSPESNPEGDEENPQEPVSTNIDKDKDIDLNEIMR